MQVFRGLFFVFNDILFWECKFIFWGVRIRQMEGRNVGFVRGSLVQPHST